MNSDRSHTWSSQLAFYLGTIGAAVGLGSIWRFPFLAGTSGGGAFIAVFALACLLVAIPLLSAEFLIGHVGRASPARVAGEAARKAGRSRRWNAIGVLGTVAATIISSYYMVIAAWVLAYTWKFAVGALSNRTPAQVRAVWDQFLAGTIEMGGWHLLFVSVVAFISARGLRGGIEIAGRVRAPALLGLMLILAAYALVTGDVERGLAFAFSPDIAAITPQVVLAAVGQAFYATGVGMAIMLAYGAYGGYQSFLRPALAISASILIVSLLASVIIFPLVFAYGLDPAMGPELVFNVLSSAFAQMPGGRLFGTLFFALLFLAALTPSIGLLEPLVAWFEERWRFARRMAALTAAGITWFLGLGSVLSFGAWSQWHPIRLTAHLAGMTVFDLADYFASNLLLPIGALLTSLFVGWRLPMAERLSNRPLVRHAVLILLRFLCPAAIVVVLLANI